MDSNYLKNHSALLTHLQSDCFVVALSLQLTVKGFNSKAEAIFDIRSDHVSPNNFFDFCRKNNFSFSPHIFSSSDLLQQIATKAAAYLNIKNKHFSVSFMPIFNNNHELEETLLIGVDISSYYAYKEKAETTNIHLSNIVNNVPHFIFWKDCSSRFLGCNKQFSDSARLDSPSDIIGKTDADMPWSKNSAQYQEDDARIISSQQAKLDYEETQTQADGTARTMLVSKLPMYDDSKICGILGIYTDITKQKQAEKELFFAKKASEQANEAKTEFLSNMRHDIRTPLSGIIGAADLIKAKTNDPELKQHAEHLISSSNALLDLLNEILDVVSLSENISPFFQGKFNLKDKVQQVVNLYQAKASSKKLKLIFNHDTTLPSYVIGDFRRLHRILLELVANAINFSDHGGVTISIDKLKQKDREVIVKISVVDTGIGIPNEQLNIIFSRFKRLTPSYKGTYRGTGNGLAVVKQFTEDLDGEIYVESEPGKGSEFTVILAFKLSLTNDDFGVKADALIAGKHINASAEKIEAADLPPTPEVSHHPDASKAKILLVEDQKIPALVAKNLLEQLGYLVDIAYSGKEATIKAKQGLSF